MLALLIKLFVVIPYEAFLKFSKFTWVIEYPFASSAFIGSYFRLVIYLLITAIFSLCMYVIA